jgi:hypothetical protein
MTFTIAPIVEGHGDVRSVPTLVARLFPEVRIATPVRMSRTRVHDDQHLARMIGIARANIREQGLILIVMDADEDCAARIGPDILTRAAAMAGDVPVLVTLAVREYESWIVGGIDDYGVTDPDAIGNLKGRIRDRESQYKETVDQQRLTRLIDTALLESRSRSFRHLVQGLRRLVPQPPTR